ncbi:MAG: FliM/FliN family flagellar motor switch protein [Pacificimonas sp.]
MTNQPVPAETEVANGTTDNATLGRQMFDPRRIPLTVSVELGQTKLKLSDLMAFREGSVVELDNDIDAPLSLYANGTLFARGEIVEQDGGFAVRIVELADAADGDDGNDGRGRS